MYFPHTSIESFKNLFKGLIHYLVWGLSKRWLLTLPSLTSLFSLNVDELKGFGYRSFAHTSIFLVARAGKLFR